MASARKLGIGIATVGMIALAAVSLSFLGAMGVALWKIEHAPVPPIPARTPKYSVLDLGSAPTMYWGYSNRDFIAQPHRLSEQGTLAKRSEAQVDEETARFEESPRLLARRWRMPREAQVQAVSISGAGSSTSTWALARSNSNGFWQEWRGGRIQKRFRSSPLGYNWKLWCYLNFHKLNGRGQAIGNTWMATACASSGGASSPHGRRVALLYERGVVRDLNVLIAPEGWYLLGAADLNQSGQILCLGLRATALQAETSRGSEHWLLLTPHSRS